MGSIIYMGMHKNLYVSDRDAELWAWVEQYAYDRRMSLSAVVMLALERLREAETGAS